MKQLVCSRPHHDVKSATLTTLKGMPCRWSTCAFGDKFWMTTSTVVAFSGMSMTGMSAGSPQVPLVMYKGVRGTTQGRGGSCSFRSKYQRPFVRGRSVGPP